MKRILSITLVLCLVLALSTSAAASGKQHDYSIGANSGIRHEVCTSLEGTSADEYYTGQYSYDQLSKLQGDALLSTLRTMLTATHTYKSTYSQCRDMAVTTDCENGDGQTISLIYTSYVATWDDWCNNRSNGWNREHVWPKAQGGFSQTDTPGCDLHHVRPSDQPVNSARANIRYGYASSGTPVYGASYTNKAPGGTKGTYFEPLDNAKGDVARICLYVYSRYGGEYSQCNNLTNVFESVDVLLEWCALDPVDTWEMGRNEVVGHIQGNRNVFIDYPELAWLLFGKEIPSNMTTPSGGKTTTPSCDHQSTEVRNEKAASCTEAGYTGDSHCVDCGKKLSSGNSVPALGHSNADNDLVCDRCGGSLECKHAKTEVRDAKAPTCGDDGFTGETYCLACSTLLEQGEPILATGDHRFNEWLVTQEPTADAPGLKARQCDGCNFVETEEVPRLDSTPSESTGATSGTNPAPTESLPQSPSDSQAPATDYRWLVFAVLGGGAVVCVAVVLIQTKRKK